MLNVNEYFSGNVKSISFDTPTHPATIGVMKKGDYEFSTDAKETMIVVNGELAVQHPGESNWQAYSDGQVFEVEGGSSFKVKALRDTAYLCKYWK